MSGNCRLAFALLASVSLAAGGASARAQDEKSTAPPAAPPAAEKKPASAKEVKVRKYLDLMRWKETMNEQFDASFAPLAKSGAIPKGFSKKFQEVADFAGLEEILVAVWIDVFDEKTLDAMIEFLGTEAGQKYVEASKKTLRPLMEKVQPWAMEAAMKTMQALGDEENGEGPEGDEGDEEGEGAMGSLQKAKLTANETSAIATLRNLASCQAQMQTVGKIDCDNDGIGEYGTLLELTGTVGVRKGFLGTPQSPESGPSDFSVQGKPLTPPIASPALAGVDADGVVVKKGYCFRIFLPDSGKLSGFVHETGPKDKPGLAGGTGKVHTDMAETTWCAYAWPEKMGDSGRRVFFVNQMGDVMQSANKKNTWEGTKAPPAHAAFLGAGITAPIAVGTAGGDGEIWRVTN